MNNTELQNAQKHLELETMEMCNAMGVSYNTYKTWRSGSRNMSASAIRCVQLLVDIKNTKIGKKYGV